MTFNELKKEWLGKEDIIGVLTSEIANLKEEMKELKKTYNHHIKTEHDYESNSHG
jgi:archaellum component FlaC